MKQADNYLESLYNFYTKPDNYETMIQVVSHFKDLKQMILRNYWDGVREELTNRIKPNDQWKCGYSDDFEARYCKLWLFKDEWMCKTTKEPILAIAFEELQGEECAWFGLWLNWGLAEYDTDSIWRAIRSLPELRKFKQDNDKSWPKWKLYQKDFSDEKHLKSIAPYNVSNEIQNAVDEFLRLQSEIDDKIEPILTKFTK